MQTFIERFGSAAAVAFGLGLLLALVILPVVSAQTPHERALDARAAAEERALQRSEGRDGEVRTTEAVRAAGEERAVEKKAEAQLRLAGKKLELCQKREQKIQNIMDRIADRNQKQLDVFTKISVRTQVFYQEKGYVLAGYDELVDEVTAKRAAAEAQVATLVDSEVTFDCEASNPKGASSAFKASLKSSIAALQEYRTAVKDLIVGVKSAQSAADDANESEVAQETEAENTEGTN